MKRKFIKILTAVLFLSSLSCYDGLNDMYDELAMKVPICVNSTTGNDLNDGRGWANAKQTIQGAINAARDGDVIWVAGSFNLSAGQSISINKSISICGGFNGTESRREEVAETSKTSITGTADPVFDIVEAGAVIDKFSFNNKTSGLSVRLNGLSYSAAIQYCLFDSNGASGIYIGNGTMNIKGCTFSNNTMRAVSINGGNIIIEDSIFTGNTDRAIFIDGQSILVISNSDFNSNTTTGDGGALYVESSANSVVTIRNGCTFDGNDAGLGGAILLGNNNTLTLADSVFKNNYADNGGAIYATKQSTDSTLLNITGCDFTANGKTDAVNGGAIYFELYQVETDTVNIVDCKFNKNKATTRGGAIYTTGSAGGNSMFNITNCDFGVKGSAFDANTATGDPAQGGALYMVNTGAIINNTDFYNNQATSGGGAIYTESSSLTINDGIFAENKVPGGTGSSGGAIQAVISGNCNLNRSTFTGNSATADGGAINFTAGTMNISDCSLNSNSVTTGNGGAINTDATCMISNSIISNNNAVLGGGFNSNNCVVVVKSSTISDNHATSFGGGFHLYFDSTSPYPVLHMINSTIKGNTAGSSGTAFYKSENTGYLYIYNSLFTDKAAETKSLVLLEAASTLFNICNSDFISHNNLGQYRNVSFDNCILYGNSITTSGGTVFRYTGTNISGNASIDFDPNKRIINASSFSNFSIGDYRLSQNSILINRGDDYNYNNPPDDNNYPPLSFDPDDIPVTDLAGNPRKVGAIDIGCYERQ